MIKAGKRVTRRSRVLKSGKIVTLDYSSVASCSIRDTSAAGARIRYLGHQPVPDEFQLLVPSENSIRDVRVIWRKEDLIGLQYLGNARRAPPRNW